MEPSRHNIPLLFVFSIGMTITMLVASVRFFANENMAIFKNLDEIPVTITEKILFMRDTTSTHP